MKNSLRLVHALITAMMFFAGIGTVIAVATAPGTVTGTTRVGLSASVDPPFTVSAGDISSLTVNRAGDVAYQPNSDAPRRFGWARLSVNARVPADDRDTRVLMVTALMIGVAGFWVALVAIRRIVASARDGMPFDPRNVGRLRLLAGLVIAAPVVAGVANRLLDVTSDSTVVHPQLADANAGTLVVIGLFVLALAEVFRKGTELQEFEESTV